MGIGGGAAVNGEGAGVGTVGAMGAAGNIEINGDAVVTMNGGTIAGTITKSKGLLFLGAVGTMYGDVSPTESFSIPEGATLTIAAGQTLTVPAGVTGVNYGTIVNNGTIVVNGKLLGYTEPTKPTNPSNPNGPGTTDPTDEKDGTDDNANISKTKAKISAEWIWIPVVLGTLIVLLTCLMFEYHRRKKAYSSVSDDEDSASE
jgi:hypothetical protein